MYRSSYKKTIIFSFIFYLAIINSPFLYTQPDKCTVKIGQKYRHYKGNCYTIVALARDSEDPSIIRVIYQGLYDSPAFGPNPVWDRAYEMFVERITINGVEQSRFELVQE